MNIIITIFIVLVGIISYFIFFKTNTGKEEKTKSNGNIKPNKIPSNTVISKNIKHQEGSDSFFKNDKGFVKLSGIRHHKTRSNLNFKLEEQVYLFPEPKNKFDKNAIKVITEKGSTIGYVSKHHNIELLELIEKGYFFIVNVSNINLDEPDYPSAILEIHKTKNSNLVPLTHKELSKLNTENEIKIKKQEKDSKKSFELSNKGCELEKTDLEEAIKHFEEAITLSNTPPIVFKRLMIHYRKIKDYSNEIRVLNKNIESVNNSKAYGYIKKDKIKEITKRINKAEELKAKNQKD